MDLDNIIFQTGSTFIFGSWICEADNNGKLQGHLFKDPDHHKEFPISTTTTDQLTKRFAQLIVSDSNQISRPRVSDPNSSSKAKFYPSAFKKPSSFWQDSRAQPKTTRITLRVLSRSRVLFHLGSTTWQNPIRDSSKDPLIQCSGYH
jgi:hypothetical protein